MKVLVTGSNGLLGSAIREVVKAGESSHEFIFATRKDADLRQFPECLQLLENSRSDAIIHTAASVGGLGAQLKHPGKFFYENLQINSNLLEAARRLRVGKVVSFLSSCVWPDPAQYPLKPTALHDGPPHPSNYGYAYAKRMLDVQSRAYSKEFGLRGVRLVPTNLYGPHDNFSLTDGHVLPALLHRMYLAKKNQEALTVWGTGKPKREFVLARDVARLSLWALENYEEEDPLFVSSSIETPIAEAVHLLAKLMKFNGEIIFDSSKSDGQMRKPTDNQKLQSLLPDFRFTSLEEGLKTTTDWFLKNYEKSRI